MSEAPATESRKGFIFDPVSAESVLSVYLKVTAINEPPVTSAMTC